MREIRVDVIRTGYPHWHGHSGLNPYPRYFDAARFRVRVHIAPDSDEDFPVQNLVVRGPLRTWVQRRGMQWYKLSDLSAEVRALGRCVRRQVDVLHYLEGEHSAQYLPLLLARLPRLRPPILATFHQPSHLLPQLLRREVIAGLDQVTVVSPEQLPFFQEILPPERVHFIPLGIDTEYFHPAGERAGSGKLRCITVGHWLRDYDLLREVAGRLSSCRDIEFHVVSPRVAGLEELPNVTVHSNLDDAALRRLYQTSDVLVLPLLSSTANCALLEAIACGLPVISTALPSVQAYLPGKEAILVERSAAEPMAEAIRYLARHPTIRTDMARSARRRAEELAWPRIAHRYQRLYEAMVAGTRSQSLG